MAEFAFNESLSMLDSGKWHKAVASQRSALSLLGPFGCAIWAVRVAFALLPFLKQVRDWNSMAAFCNERLNKRIKVSHSSVAYTHKLTTRSVGHQGA